VNTISIIDLGIGNIASVIRMIEKLGGQTKIVSTPDEILSAKKLIFPGVGSFDAGINQIHLLGLRDSLTEMIMVNKIPVLGICLGMQLLCRGSEEGLNPGLNLVAADVRKFRPKEVQNLKIPHMGWNTLRIIKKNPLLSLTAEETRYYFVHSYYVQPDDENIIIGASDYGGDFCAVFQNDNVFGVQFHPEKSHRFGLDLFANFMNL
jgi:imidazole glycerol-phosphate synthase subunit HisH